MPASENVLQLLINLDRKPVDVPDYECRYRLAGSVFTLSLFPAGVAVDWENGDSWFEEGNKPKKEFYDAIRKAYLLYALYFGDGLKIERYTVVRNGIPESAISYGDDAYFPYMESVILPGDLVPEAGEFKAGKIFRNRTIMNFIAKSKRSDDQSDTKITALFAYLHSKCRRYEVDRFLNLWTAINALYNDINRRHTRWVEKLVDEIPDDVLEKLDLPRDLVRQFYTVSDKNDNEPRRLLIKLVHERLDIHRKNKGSKERVLKEFSGEDTDFFTPFVTGYSERNEGRMTPGSRRVPLLVKRYFYRAVRADAERLSDEASEDEQELYRRLRVWADRTGASLFSFLTFELPYYKRNYYIHGSEATLLISSCYSISYLACLNYFMERFLEKYIPQMFNPRKMDALIREYHQLLYEERKGLDDVYTSENEADPKTMTAIAIAKLLRNQLKKDYAKAEWMAKVKGLLPN